jgi:hypothetical protein
MARAFAETIRRTALLLKQNARLQAENTALKAKLPPGKDKDKKK